MAISISHSLSDHRSRKSGPTYVSAMSLLLAFLLAVSTTACNTAPTRSDMVVTIPQEAVVTDRAKGPTWTEYNAIVSHAKGLRDELEREQGRRKKAEEAARVERCNKKHAERSERCLYNRVQSLESSWMPGRMIPGEKCTVPEPECEE